MEKYNHVMYKNMKINQCDFELSIIPKFKDVSLMKKLFCLHEGHMKMNVSENKEQAVKMSPGVHAASSIEQLCAKDTAEEKKY